MADLLPTPPTRRQTAELIGTSARTLRRWEEQQKGPPALRFSRRVTRYNIVAVRAWLDLVNIRAARGEELYSEEDAR